MDGLGLPTAARTAGVNDMMVGRVSRVASGSDQGTPEAVAREMESLFATMLVSELRKGLGEGFFGGGAGADTFNGWFDEQIGASLASRSSLGLADQIRESIMREQAAAAAEAARESSESGEAS
ncbi:MAG: rod-binding protein [Planctomycetota bacterium]|nr:rod-binding protein [Planctomycetota bacterium]MEC8511509.1 rod-binding protein [Planctomycetota bacterium]